MQPAAEPSPSTPEQFGPYELYERLGMGGMATVYRAKKRGPEGFERTVALKRMLSHLAEDQSFVESFIREAKVASLLAHPNIAQVYDFGRINGTYYIAMELVAGSDLRRLLRYANRANEAISLPVVFSVLAELCDALEYAHGFVDEHGTPLRIVHRDISPSNLIIAPTGHVKVIDFGIAKASARQRHTESGLAKGKLGYMAPEVALGLTVAPGADVFSLGVVAWELITAQPLFTSRSDFETMRRLREDPVVAPSQVNPDCPPELDALVLRAADRDHERRLPSASAFRRQLDHIAARYGISLSAHAVADWIAQFPSTQVSQRMATQPAEHATAVLRPSMRSKLHRSHDDIALASEIWGEDAHTVAPSGDFSMGSGHVAPMSRPSAVGTRAPRRARTRGGWYVLIAVLTIVAGALAAVLVAKSAHEASESATPGAASAAGSAIAAGAATGAPAPGASESAAPHSQGKVRFAIEPAGATVSIGTNDPGHTAPFETELDPGVYSVAVRYPGYQSRDLSITVTAGAQQIVDLALEPAAAVASTGYNDANRPIPGHHHSNVVGKHAAAHDPDPIAATPTAATPTPLPTPPPVEPPVVTPPTPPPPAITSPPATPPPPPVVKDKDKHVTPVVGANAVTKLSGDLPTLRGESDGDVLAKMCIDEHGAVSSVKIMKSPADIADTLQHALTTWKYKPYIGHDDAPSPVCFPLQMHVIVKRPD